jgi:acetamidase/formamidase
LARRAGERPALLLLCGLLAAPVLFGANYALKISPETTVWGYYWSEVKPVLTIQSGDIVEVATQLDTDPARLEQLGVPPDQITREMRELYEKVPPSARGGQQLTGPIAIEGAQPGDVLEVRILKIKMDLPYAYNGYGNFMFKDFQRGARIVPLDRERMIGHVAPGVDVPLRPFFGGMGVAPPSSMGKIKSGPPGIHAGNLDNRDLVEGSTLYIPVHVAGALFQVGDGHAAQGEGEVDRNALETSLTGTFQFIVRHDMHLKWPRAETPTHYIAMGLDPDLNEAAKLAILETIDFLMTEKKMSHDDAYVLASVGVDFVITQCVDGTLGVHSLIPKSLFKSRN